MSTVIEQEESDTKLYGCIKDSVVVVSLIFFCNSFSDEQRFSVLADIVKIIVFIVVPAGAFKMISFHNVHYYFE